MKNNQYLKYSGMAIQMGAIILLGVLGGRWIDGSLQLEVPVFTIVFALLSVAAALYLTLKDLVKKK